MISIEKEIVVAVSGFFAPIHVGHVSLFKEAKKLGDKLIVIVNTDVQTALKGSTPFMDEEERLEIVQSVRYVDEAILSIDKDCSVAETLRLIKPDIFCQGGDKTTEESWNPRETEVCKEMGVRIIGGVGGSTKQQSSSQLIKNAIKAALTNFVER